MNKISTFLIALISVLHYNLYSVETEQKEIKDMPKQYLGKFLLISTITSDSKGNPIKEVKAKPKTSFGLMSNDTFKYANNKKMTVNVIYQLNLKGNKSTAGLQVYFDEIEDYWLITSFKSQKGKYVLMVIDTNHNTKATFVIQKQNP